MAGVGEAAPEVEEAPAGPYRVRIGGCAPVGHHRVRQRKGAQSGPSRQKVVRPGSTGSAAARRAWRRVAAIGLRVIPCATGGR